MSTKAIREALAELQRRREEVGEADVMPHAAYIEVGNIERAAKVLHEAGWDEHIRKHGTAWEAAAALIISAIAKEAP